MKISGNEKKKFKEKISLCIVKIRFFCEEIRFYNGKFELAMEKLDFFVKKIVVQLEYFVFQWEYLIFQQFLWIFTNGESPYFKDKRIPHSFLPKISMKNDIFHAFHLSLCPDKALSSKECCN